LREHINEALQNFDALLFNSQSRKFLLASMSYLLILRNRCSNSLQRPYSGNLDPEMLVQKTACDYEKTNQKLPLPSKFWRIFIASNEGWMDGHWRTLTNHRRGNFEQVCIFFRMRNFKENKSLS